MFIFVLTISFMSNCMSFIQLFLPKKLYLIRPFLPFRRYISRSNFNMVYTEEYISEKLKKHLNATHITVEDQSDGCGAKFNTVIVSEKFNGVPLLQRHRMVNEVLKEEMKEIHAFQQRTLTPEQWEKQNS